MASFVVREYGSLLRGGDFSTLDKQSIPISAWDWLSNNCATIAEGKKAKFLKIAQVDGQIVLKSQNFVGVVRTPCENQIEILPKTNFEGMLESETRKILVKMLDSVWGLGLSEFTAADIEILKRPLNEILISEFLDRIFALLARGLQADYNGIEAEERVLKGKLNITRQIRQSPARQQYFHIAYDVFSFDRPENRIVHLALAKLRNSCYEPQNQLRVRELLVRLSDIPLSADPARDLAAWRFNPSMRHYNEIKTWCRFVLEDTSPLTMSGEFGASSFLIPMEKLFEKYVCQTICGALPRNWKGLTQPKNKSLVKHREKSMFALNPTWS